MAIALMQLKVLVALIFRVSTLRVWRSPAHQRLASASNVTSDPMHDAIYGVLRQTYGGSVNASSHSAHLTPAEEEEWAKHPSNEEDTNAGNAMYGEITPDGMRMLLQFAGAKPPEIFYDLGSGEGKAVITAWLMGLKSTGIELAKKRFDSSCIALRKVEKLQIPEPASVSSQLRFVHGSFTELSFADADIIFLNNVVWDDKLMHAVASDAMALKKGARILAAKPLPGQDFEDRGSLRVPVTWCIEGVKDSCAYEYKLQEKVSASVTWDHHGGSAKLKDFGSMHSLTRMPKEDHCELLV